MQQRFFILPKKELTILKIALIQMQSSFDKTATIQHACALIRQEVQAGAEIVVLPEMFCCPYATQYFRAYGEYQGGEAQTALSALAAELAVMIVAGSLPELEADRVYNTSFVYDQTGKQIARHRKMHLFDIDVQGGQKFCESEVLTAGDQVTVFPTPWGKIGLCICFDIRFSELFRLMALQGAELVIVPAAFNMTTGPAHWQLHFRARALDNQLFTIGVSPARQEDGCYVAYGHSIAVDPWGNLLYQAGSEATAHTLEIDFAQVRSVRQQLPILSARRSDIYELKLKVKA